MSEKKIEPKCSCICHSGCEFYDSVHRPSECVCRKPRPPMTYLERLARNEKFHKARIPEQ